MTRETGLLRWGELTASLQHAAARGVFGPNVRLYQLADGSWQLMESFPVMAGEPRVQGGVLYPGPILGPGGEPVLVGGVPSTDDPEPGVVLNAMQLAESTGVVWYRREEVEDEWTVPGEFEVVTGVVSGGGPLEFAQPVLLVRHGRAVRVNVIF